MAYTVAYQNDGFPSFYSFDPEMAIGMNNYLYTFKNGQIYKHGFGNKFYGNDISSSFITHFNDSPTEIKMFKTLSQGSTIKQSLPKMNCLQRFVI